MRRVKDLYFKYERYLSAVALISGFIWDNLTLVRVDFWLDNLILFAYLLIAAGSILMINAAKSVKFFSFALQFVFGGLFSAFVVFFGRSASFSASWPFIIFLGALLIGNELFRERYEKSVFQLSIFYTALFSYCVLLLPIFLGSIGITVFLMSGFVSLALFGIVFLALFYVSNESVKNGYKKIFLSIGVIYAAFNLFYFTNIIPPIPLSLKDTGVFYSIKKMDGNYTGITAPNESFFSFYRAVPWKKGMPVYVYSAVFAPSGLNTKIYHKWWYYDENMKDWVLKNRMGFEIIGGRDGGYRGYTLKSDVKPGKWRVDIVTERDQGLGYVKFRVLEVDSLPELRSVVLN